MGGRRKRDSPAGNRLRLPYVSKLIFEMGDALEDIYRDPGCGEYSEEGEEKGDGIVSAQILRSNDF
ncbi:MAG: hypothetical protein FJ010_11475 [Chloroflexi bacterium]|nr:hypothetical protein [Chloroflexota bacterium]